jgi:hypothetical protein
MQMRPLAEELARRGQRVFVALRQLDRAAASAFAGAGVSFLPAPGWHPGTGGGAPREHPVTFTQLLMNVGFADDGELTARCAAWRNLYRMVKPDLLVFDYSPAAMLASHGFDFRRAAIGSGFCCPPPDAEAGRPWAVLRPHAAATIEPWRLLEDEKVLLARVNRVLGKWRQPPFEHISRLYADLDENFLTTFPELDHFPQRRGTARYWGPVIGDAPGCVAPQWPDGEGKRVYVYLKNSEATPELLERLPGAGAPVLAFIDGLAPERRRRFASPSLRLPDRPVDLRRAAAECDAAILSGGAGSTAEVLLAGKPVVEVPSALEQVMTADAVERLGVGVKAAGGAGAILSGIKTVTGDERYTKAARHFAQRYLSFDSAVQRRAMAGRACELIGAGARRPNPELAN